MAIRHARLWGMYERPIGTKRWKRMNVGCSYYNRAQAARVFQNWLLGPYLDGLPVERCLKPIRLPVQRTDRN